MKLEQEVGGLSLPWKSWILVELFCYRISLELAHIPEAMRHRVRQPVSFLLLLRVQADSCIRRLLLPCQEIHGILLAFSSTLNHPSLA